MREGGEGAGVEGRVREVKHVWQSPGEASVYSGGVHAIMKLPRTMINSINNDVDVKITITI